MIAAIETARTILRGWNDDDVESWAQMNADPRVMEFFPSTYARERSIASAATMRAELERDGYGWFVVELKDRMPFAGVIALQPVPFEARFTPAKEIGWRFLPAAWGHGYATEAASAAMRFAFEELGWDQVVALTARINVPSQRVMERLHMTHDPDDDFGHPRVEEGHRLHHCVLYRARATLLR
ncbi:MAG TPA: GNAT family N-acetyltransferase [Candidatus Baltobacteraceae bacterium]|jgi:ribosomal-protein-alanine N-acetyltransferase